MSNLEELEQYRKDIKPCLPGYCEDSAWDELVDRLFSALRQSEAREVGLASAILAAENSRLRAEFIGLHADIAQAECLCEDYGGPKCVRCRLVERANKRRDGINRY